MARKTVKSPLALEGTIYEQFHPGRFEIALQRLERNHYLSGEELAVVLAHNGPAALPEELHEYLIRHLRGETRSRKGYLRRQTSRHVRDMIGLNHYEEALQEIHEDQAQAGTPNRRNIPPRAEPAIHERAMKIAADKVGMTPQTLRNRLSKQRLLGAAYAMRLRKGSRRNSRCYSQNFLQKLRDQQFRPISALFRF